MKKILNILPDFLKEKLINYYIGYRLLTKKDFFLFEMGYTRSYHDQIPMTKDGEFLPWMNYAIIDFLNKRLNKNQSFFEFGSGYSSIYYAKKVKEVTSIEYDLEWKNKVQVLFKNNNLENVNVHFQKINEDYPKTIQTIYPNKKYDIVLVDGRMRVACAKEALNCLTENGIVILDDSSREKYQEIFEFYEKK